MTQIKWNEAMEVASKLFQKVMILDEEVISDLTKAQEKIELEQVQKAKNDDLVGYLMTFEGNYTILDVKEILVFLNKDLNEFLSNEEGNYVQKMMAIRALSAIATFNNEKWEDKKSEFCQRLYEIFYKYDISEDESLLMNLVDLLNETEE